jgi:hypothetical protein
MWTPWKIRQQCKQALALCQEATENTKRSLALVDSLLAENATLRQKFTVEVKLPEPPAASLAAMASITEVVQ